MPALGLGPIICSIPKILFEKLKGVKETQGGTRTRTLSGLKNLKNYNIQNKN